MHTHVHRMRTHMLSICRWKLVWRWTSWNATTSFRLISLYHRANYEFSPRHSHAHMYRYMYILNNTGVCVRLSQLDFAASAHPECTRTARPSTSSPLIATTTTTTSTTEPMTIRSGDIAEQHNTEPSRHHHHQSSISSQPICTYDRRASLAVVIVFNYVNGTTTLMRRRRWNCWTAGAPTGVTSCCSEHHHQLLWGWVGNEWERVCAACAAPCNSAICANYCVRKETSRWKSGWHETGVRLRM